jgi:hypothetical protein
MEDPGGETMASAGIVMKSDSIQSRLVGVLAGMGVWGWAFFLPLSQAHQHIKATSIAIFVILGAFLLDVFVRGFRSSAIRPLDFHLLFPLAFLALLPLLHASHSLEAQKQLVLRAPFFVLPFLLMYTARSQASSLRAGVAVFLALGLFLVLVLLFSQGMLPIFRAVRAMTDDRFWWVISRPYLGLWIGVLVFSAVGLLQNREKRNRPHFLCLAGLGICGLLLAYWVLAKLAFLCLSVCLVGYSLHNLWRKPVVSIPVVLGLLSLSGWGIWQVSQSQAWADFTTYGEIRFSTVSKTYSNSVNNRLILWRSAFDLLTETNNWAGLPPEHLQNELDARVARYNGYLKTVHLNPHNQFLSMVLGYGWLGILVWAWVWLSYFLFAAKRGTSWFWGTVFLFLCSHGEVYWDREMGVQLFILWAFLLWLAKQKASEPIAISTPARTSVS